MSEHVTEAAHKAGDAVEHAGHGIKATLSKKLGPMPVGGWLLAVLGGVAVALYFRNRSAGSDTTDLPTDPPGEFDPNAPNGFDQADPGGTNPGVGGGVDTGGNPTTPGTSAAVHHSEAYKAKHAKDNPTWEAHAILAMTQVGFHSSQVRNTLQAYLHGNHLGAGAKVTLDATLARCGPPPNPPKKQPGPGVQHPPAHPGRPIKDTGQTPPTKPVPQLPGRPIAH